MQSVLRLCRVIWGAPGQVEGKRDGRGPLGSLRCLDGALRKEDKCRWGTVGQKERSAR